MKNRLLILLLLLTPALLHAKGDIKTDTIAHPVAHITYTIIDTTDDCEVRVTFHNESFVRFTVGSDTLDSVGVCSNFAWTIDNAHPGSPNATELLALGEHSVSLVAILFGTSDTISDTLTIPFFVSDFCHCYDTIRDTIVENELPWKIFGDTYSLRHDIDTTFFFPGPGHPVCDTVIDYHLKVWWNYHDTVDYYACKGNLPIMYDSVSIHGDTVMNRFYHGIHGEDSLVYFTLSTVPGTDTTIYDTVVEDQLPWFFFDTLFVDTVGDQIFVTYNTNGCDSTIHYNLYIYWNGDHCDTTLSFGNVVTPNGDGINDKFIIGGLLSNDCYRYNELTIYDRTGHRVYHHKNIASDDDWWDPGADRIPSGTYFYIFKAHGINIRTQHNGVIEVLREKK